ncbi:MAG: 2-amino-4-hydroxy-6-hydroxymethyldihydropteridine diphosphokinase [Verrucomicrobiota bacterium]
MTTAHFALGSNLGDRRAHLASALAALAATPGIRVSAVSPVYETAPVGPPGQDDYLNAVAALETGLAPHALLDTFLAIERDHGRVRTERWGPRTLDLDLLRHGENTVHDERLTLPHPRLHERAFVMIPLAAIAPDLVLADGRTAATIAASLDATGVHLRPDLALA